MDQIKTCLKLANGKNLSIFSAGDGPIEVQSTARGETKESDVESRNQVISHNVESSNQAISRNETESQQPGAVSIGDAQGTNSRGKNKFL